MLAAEPIPTFILTHVDEARPGVRRALGRIARHGLARLGSGDIQLHRLVQTIILDQLSTAQHTNVKETTERTLAAADPGDTELPSTRALWRRYIPHLRALDPASSDNADLRAVASRAVRHLLVHGEHESGRQLATNIYHEWRDRLGPDHPDTLHAATGLAMAWDIFGNVNNARKLREDTLTRQRRLQGVDHRATLQAAQHLAEMLAEDDIGEGLAMLADTLGRQRRTLGKDHPETLMSMSIMARLLSRAGDHDQALAMARDAWERQRHNLGDDHPWTVNIGLDLVDVLTDVGDVDDARLLAEQVIAAARRVFDTDGVDVHLAECVLAMIRFRQGHRDSARQLALAVLARSAVRRGENHPDTLYMTAMLAPIINMPGN